MTTSVRTYTTDDVLHTLAGVPGSECAGSAGLTNVVESVILADDGVTVRLRLPVESYSTAAAYLLVSDSLDALRDVEGLGRVAVVVENHPDSAVINADVAAAQWDLGPERSDAFARLAYRAAVERSVALHLMLTGEGLGRIESLTLRDLRGAKHTTSLLRRRSALGLSLCPNSRVCVDDHGRAMARGDVHMTLRISTSYRP